MRTPEPAGAGQGAYGAARGSAGSETSHASGRKDFGRLAGILATRIERLTLEERDAVRRRDWSAARTSAEERAILQEAHHRALARHARTRYARPRYARTRKRS